MKKWIFIFGIVIISAVVIILFFANKKDNNINVTYLNHDIIIDPYSVNPDPNYALYNPIELEQDSNGNIYILDRGNNRIMVYDYKMKFLNEIGRVGQGPGEMIEPTDIVLDKDGNIYIADPINSRITILDNTGSYINTIRLTIKFPITLNITVDSEGLIYMNTLDSLVTVLNHKGKILNSFGKIFFSEIPSSLRYWNTVSLDFDAEDNLWVIFNCKPIIRKYNKNGKLIFEFEPNNPEISEAQKTEKPRSKTSYTFYYTDICCSKRNKIYVGAHDYIHEFNLDGFLTQRFNTTFPQHRKNERYFYINRFIYNERENNFWGISKFDGIVFILR